LGEGRSEYDALWNSTEHVFSDSGAAARNNGLSRLIFFVESQEPVCFLVGFIFRKQAVRMCLHSDDYYYMNQNKNKN